MYTAPLSALISGFRNVISHRLYADDTQVYIAITPDNAPTSVPELQKCLCAIQDWMSTNELKLNPDKTEFIVVGTETQHSKLADLFPMDILYNMVSPTDKVRNLGVIFDKDFSFHNQVMSIRKSCFYHIRDFARIRRYLSKSASITLANALVSSRLDYSNSMLNSISLKDLKLLQGVQNSLCRVVCRLSKYSSVTAARKSLHWLPIKERIDFKGYLLTYKAFHTGLPPSFSIKSTKEIHLHRD